MERTTGADPAPAPVVEGVINGARFAIARPPGAWNHQLLLIAHGYRIESAPLIPNLHPERLACHTLLDEGWMVATTSYRRNGMIVADAIDDLDALRARIVHDYGDLDRTVLLGESMGGLIVTIMAEREPGLYSGAIAIDPALSASESNMTVGLSLLPRIPLLFLATQRQFIATRGYMTALVARPQPIVPPALFTIARDGRSNVNQQELLTAVRALDRWLDDGRGSLPQPADDARYFDATVPPDPGPSTVAVRADRRGFTTRILEIDAATGDVTLDAQPGDFVGAGIELMMFFQLRAGASAYRVCYGRGLDSVRQGEWVAFGDAEGRTLLAMNFADAAGAARLRAGDSLTVIRYDPPPR